MNGIKINTVSGLEKRLHKIAVRLAIKSGLATNADQVNVQLRIANRGKHHDGWTTDISEAEWKKILSLDWDEKERRLLEAVQNSRGSLTGEKIQNLGFCLDSESFHEINQGFKRNLLPFHFACQEKLLWHKRASGKFSLYRKPIGV